MAERTTVRLPSELIRRAKRKAASEGRTLTALIEEGLRSVLHERTLAGTPQRLTPRVSEARGGLLPGINLDDSAALQELENLDYAERLK